jgi:hypothetical protein
MVQHSTNQKRGIGQNPRLLIGRVRVTRITVLTAPMCCVMERIVMKARTDQGARRDGGFMAIQSVV